VNAATWIRRGYLETEGGRLEACWLGPPPGEAPTLVFLHEGLGCVAGWKGFPAEIAAATGCGALIYSRAGYGRSDPVSLPRPLDYHASEATTVLPRILEATGIRRAVLVGHSDGATIALLHAGRVRDPRVEGLVLMAPHVFNESDCIAGIRAIAESWRSGGLRERLRRLHGANVDVAFEGWRDAWLDPDFRDWNIEDCLPAIGIPVQLIQGLADEYGTLVQLEAIAARAGGPVETVKLAQCGHIPYRDRPRATRDHVSAFIRRCLGLADPCRDSDSAAPGSMAALDSDGLNDHEQ